MWCLATVLGALDSPVHAMEQLYSNKYVFNILIAGAIFAILVQAILLSFVVVLPERPADVRPHSNEQGRCRQAQQQSDCL